MARKQEGILRRFVGDCYQGIELGKTFDLPRGAFHLVYGQADNEVNGDNSYRECIARANRLVVA